MNSQEKPLEERVVRVPGSAPELEGRLRLPAQPRGVVLLAAAAADADAAERARGSLIQEQLAAAGFATLQLERLASDAESHDLAAAVEGAARRWLAATDWLLAEGAVSGLALGYFSAGAGVAPALHAASQRGRAIAAVVVHAGRPDLAGTSLSRLRAPTLLVVGGDDVTALAHHRRALARLRAPDRRLFIVPGARSRFEEPGALETLARLAADWFGRHLGGEAVRAAR